MGYQEFTIEGRNAVIEAYRAGKPIDKLFILDGCQDGPMMTIKREAKKHDTLVKYVTKERLDQLSETGKQRRKRVSRPLFSCWIISRILIIWELSSVPPIWQVPMVSSSRRIVQQD